MEKLCGACQTVKPLTEFSKNKRKPDGLQTNCKVCMTAHAREYYKVNNVKQRQQIRDAARRRREANKVNLVAAKNKPCMDCGNNYPSFVMDFDHVRGDKVMNVSEMMQHVMPWARIEEEILKCDLVCANCHRIRTFTRSAVSSEAELSTFNGNVEIS